MNYWPFCIHIIHLKPKMQLIRHVVNLYKFLSRLVFMFLCQCFEAFECITETYRQLVVYLPYWSTSVWEAFPLEFSLVGDIETSSHDMFNFINFGHLERFAYTCNNKMLTSYTTFICVEYMTKKCNLFQIKDDIGLTNSVLFLNFKKQRIT